MTGGKSFNLLNCSITFTLTVSYLTFTKTEIRRNYEICHDNKELQSQVQVRVLYNKKKVYRWLQNG